MGRTEHHGAQFAAARVGQTQRTRRGGEAGAQCLVGVRRVAERLAAGRLRGAAAQDHAECGLGVQGDRRAEREAGRHDAIEDHAAHAIGIAPQVVLRDPRPVGHPVEIHLGGAERLAHSLEVADRDAGGVLRHIMLRAQGVETFPGRGVDDPVADRRGRLRTVEAVQQRVDLAR